MPRKEPDSMHNTNKRTISQVKSNHNPQALKAPQLQVTLPIPRPSLKQILIAPILLKANQLLHRHPNSKHNHNSHKTNKPMTIKQVMVNNKIQIKRMLNIIHRKTINNKRKLVVKWEIR